MQTCPLRATLIAVVGVFACDLGLLRAIARAQDAFLPPLSDIHQHAAQE